MRGDESHFFIHDPNLFARVPKGDPTMDDIYGICVGKTELCDEFGKVREVSAMGLLTYNCTGFRHYDNDKYLLCSSSYHKKENVMEALNPAPQDGDKKGIKDEVIDRYATWRLATQIVDELFALVDVNEYKTGAAFGPYYTTTVLDQRLEATIRCANWLLGEDS